LLFEKNAKSFREEARKKFVDPSDLGTFCENLRKEGKTIATLNGSFDLLHPGHYEMIYQGACQADILLLLLNTDASIRGYKGPDRPINPLEVRLLNMAAIGMVDCLTWFDEFDPIAKLDIIRPDVHVNGSEYGEDCIEAEVVKKHGGRIHIVSLVNGFSSTNLIEKIRSVT
jgi:rfaE bifunctional protein nucleotidyltransferase chain/domain